MEIRGKRFLVVGLGRTGGAVIPFLFERGAEVVAVDERADRRVKETLETLQRFPVEVQLGRFRSELFEEADTIIASPGVPLTLEAFQRARAKGIPIIGEVELASRFLEVPILAITGTSGKTTTTSLVGEMLRRSGLRCFVGGNIGDPLIEAVSLQRGLDWIIAEVSSFQLESIETFRPRIAVLLNMTEDHLDRYETVNDYFRAKLRIFLNQGHSDRAVLNGDDPTVVERTRTIVPEKSLFGFEERGDRVAFAKGERLIYRGSKGEEIYPLDGFRLRGRHNLSNLMAAIVAARLAGAKQNAIVEAYRSFQGLEHRLEYVASIGGIDFYNDSKATTVDCVVRALESFEKPILWIAGGKDKGVEYSLLKDVARKRVKRAILMGEAADRMRKGLNGTVPVRVAADLEEAVLQAYREAEAGDLILLSPACSSYDMFNDYIERGEVFKKIVTDLLKGKRDEKS